MLPACLILALHSLLFTLRLSGGQAAPSPAP